MRLFWKLFCSMVTITALACSIGGFVLIDGQFRAGLDAQAELVTSENTLLRRTLLRQMQFSRTFTQEEAARLAGETSESRDSVRFRLSDGEGTVLAGHRLAAASSLVPSLEENEAGWEVLRSGDRFYLHAAAPVVLEDGTVYLENWREVGNLFALRKTQYTVFFYVLLGLLLATALAALALSAWMTRPLGRLSEAARQVAGGALERRDISDALLFTALLWFLADIALRKLPWERALARAMARRGAGAAARPAKPAREKAPSARRRPAARRSFSTASPTRPKRP